MNTCRSCYFLDAGRCTVHLRAVQPSGARCPEYASLYFSPLEARERREKRIVNNEKQKGTEQ